MFEGLPIVSGSLEDPTGTRQEFALYLASDHRIVGRVAIIASGEAPGRSAHLAAALANYGDLEAMIEAVEPGLDAAAGVLQGPEAADAALALQRSLKRDLHTLVAAVRQARRSRPSTLN